MHIMFIIHTAHAYQLCSFVISPYRFLVTTSQLEGKCERVGGREANAAVPPSRDGVG